MSDLLVQFLKKEAKKIAAKALLDGQEICHGHALKDLSQRLGYPNWNTLRAIAVRDPEQVNSRLNKAGYK